MQDEEAAVTAWGLDLTHGEVGTLSKHIAPEYAACLCPQQMFGSLEVSLGLKVLAITAAAARRFGLWTCAVLSCTGFLELPPVFSIM